MLRAHHEKETGEPMPSYLDLGFASSIALKAGAAHGCHVDFLDDHWSMAAVFTVDLGTGSFRDCHMWVPQVKAVVPTNCREYLWRLLLSRSLLTNAR